jgi:hypothetical protein
MSVTVDPPTDTRQVNVYPGRVALSSALELQRLSVDTEAASIVRADASGWRGCRYLRMGPRFHGREAVRFVGDES